MKETFKKAAVGCAKEVAKEVTRSTFSGRRYYHRSYHRHSEDRAMIRVGRLFAVDIPSKKPIKDLLLIGTGLAGVGATYYLAKKYIDYKFKEKENEIDDENQPDDIQTTVPEVREKPLSEVINYGKNAPNETIGGFIYSDTNTLIFGPRGSGKSTLAFQIAFAAANGTELTCFPKRGKIAPPQEVIFIDTEMSESSLASRYHDQLKGIVNIKRVSELNTGEKILAYIEEKTESLKGNRLTVILDNLSMTDFYRNPKRSRDFYSQLQVIQNRALEQRGKRLSVILVGHTQKNVKQGMLLDSSNFEGTNNLGNFAKNIIGINMTEKKGIFFIQILKDRDGDLGNNVFVEVRTEKPYPQFCLYYEEEKRSFAERIKGKNFKAGEGIPPELILRQIAMDHTDENGLSLRSLGEKYGVSQTTINKWITVFQEGNKNNK